MMWYNEYYENMMNQTSSHTSQTPLLHLKKKKKAFIWKHLFGVDCVI